MIYPVLRKYLFTKDPEKVHEQVLHLLTWISHHKLAQVMLSARYQTLNEKLEQEYFGIKFPNPIGLAAGFDKNAVAVPAWEALGFGFAEIGTVTPRFQVGNPKPRMFRLVEEQSIINRMGFNNEGADQVVFNLKHSPPVSIPVGISIGKQKETSEDDAHMDYTSSFGKLYPYGDYFAVNVSSPNTPGLRKLQNPLSLSRIIGNMREVEKRLPQYNPAREKPILVKIAPDLEKEQIDEIVEQALKLGVAGIIACNTTVSRTGLKKDPNETGGLSGPLLRDNTLKIVQHIHEQAPTLPIMGVGGISEVDDVFEYMDAGATLFQVYTAFPYHGPSLASGINTKLLEYLEEFEFSDLIEYIQHVNSMVYSS